VRLKSAYVAWLALHLLLITVISCRDTLWLVAARLTILPSCFNRIAQALEPVSTAALGRNLAPSHPLRRTLLTYCHIAGIDRGYGYFAPNVPGNYKLVFELHYSDGRVAYDLPVVGSRAAGLRIASLLDEIGRTRSEALREFLIKMLAQAAWREHPDVEMLRAIFSSRELPDWHEFKRGARESDKFLYAYDFRREEEGSASLHP
jgi:hypothetical protein